MLSDEEKEAIEYWKTYMEILHWNTQLASEHYIKVLLDLIEKKSKEIEELSDKLTEKICKGVEEEILEEYRQTIISKDKEIEGLKEDNKKKSIVIIEYQDLYEKLVDKIKAKIEELENDPNNLEEHNCLRADTCYVINVLQSLLEKEQI